jgi:hypothetical protein
MAALAQTIAVIDKSGKVVSSSKHLLGVFKEAKSAYRERKAEILATKKAKFTEREARRALAAYSIADSHTVTSSRGGPRRSQSVTRHPDESRRHLSGDSVHHNRSTHLYEQDLHSTTSSRLTSQRLPTELARRHTSNGITVANPRHLDPRNRSFTAPHVDMDLAFGDFHHSSLERSNHSPEGNLNGLVKKAKKLLVEADCAQHSVSAMVAHLQKHPEAMAAVALTLAEISNVASKMAPGALAALRASAPSVFALLASPQFMIAAGVGIGVTIVMFGGYKIIKQIKAAGNANEESMDEMMRLNTDVGSVERWRRGVANIEATSVGTSVDGEFITPKAAAMSGILAPSDTVSNSSRGSMVSRTSRATRREASDKGKKGKKKSDKKKKPSPLRLLFK